MEIKHAFTFSESWLNEIADQMAKASSLNMFVKNNQLVFPSRIGTGTWRYIKLYEGLFVFIQDTIYKVPITFIREEGHRDAYILHLDCSEQSLAHCIAEHTTEIGAKTGHTIFFSSFDIKSSISPPLNSPVTSVTIIVKRQFIFDHFLKDANLPIKNTHIDDFIHNLPVRFYDQMGIKKLKIVREILNARELPDHVQRAYIKGCVYQLWALFVNKVANDMKIVDSTIDIHEIAGIMAVKDELISDFEKPPLRIKDAADQLSMGTTKFKNLFKKVFNKCYYEYYQEMRMEKARQLLDEKTYSISQVAYKVGFSNLGHFSKLFKLYYGKNPSQYIIESDITIAHNMSLPLLANQKIFKQDTNLAV